MSKTIPNFIDIRNVDPEKVKAWDTALRETHRVQTQHHLRDDYGDCCLGVYLDVNWVEEGRGVWQQHDGSAHLRFCVPDREILEGAALPLIVAREELGQTTATTLAQKVLLNVPPDLQSKARGQKSHSATGLNDGYDFTFLEIADCVRFTYWWCFE